MTLPRSKMCRSAERSFRVPAQSSIKSEIPEFCSRLPRYKSAIPPASDPRMDRLPFRQPRRSEICRRVLCLCVLRAAMKLRNAFECKKNRTCSMPVLQIRLLRLFAPRDDRHIRRTILRIKPRLFPILNMSETFQAHNRPKA